MPNRIACNTTSRPYGRSTLSRPIVSCGRRPRPNRPGGPGKKSRHRPTPIASPGQDAISAVLDPADGAWLYWVTVNLETGETLFAETYADHLANVELLREWQAANSG